MTSQVAALEVQEFGSEDTEKDLLEHLSKHHSVPSYSVNSKSTKEFVLSWHARVHQFVEEGTEQSREQNQRYIRKPGHIHRAVTAESIRAAGVTPLVLDKPLTASEASALKGLIDNDFNALAQDMRAMAADAKADRVRTVNAEWDAKKDNQAIHAERARRLVASFTVDRDRLIERAAADGVELSMPSFRYGSGSDVTTALIGRAQAIGAVGVEIANDLSRALLSLERQRLTAQRAVILARVTPEAAKVLEQVPDAKTLMVAAANERAANEQKVVGA